MPTCAPDEPSEITTPGERVVTAPIELIVWPSTTISGDDIGTGLGELAGFDAGEFPGRGEGFTGEGEAFPGGGGDCPFVTAGAVGWTVGATGVFPAVAGVLAVVGGGSGGGLHCVEPGVGAVLDISDEDPGAIIILSSLAL